MTTRTAFISGPLDPSDAYFRLHYEPLIQTAIRAGDSFIVGPVAGVDAMALSFLLRSGVQPQRITVYMAHFEYYDEPRKLAFETLGVNVRLVGPATATTRDRDAAMTAASDYDILRYRTEAEAKAEYGPRWYPRVSNTEMNERRRRGISSAAYTLPDVSETNSHRSSRKLKILEFFKFNY
ncbi:hypothetical protein EJ04DRAFT_561594 [Polyplosphaeria fusca]|uniref:Uncharacterized protein n=1 Tax=Polyplosphaeria fusca TaxID=682080 RepID=A0A9P4R681_9PLEO|nr:hypothetical protein EJ04DRAFT_561594 [Polyplosphaeria fusca]